MTEGKQQIPNPFPKYFLPLGYLIFTMALFQKTVLKKHLLEANTPEVDAAYKRFSAYFHDATRQQNIRNSKEEQFQEGFLRELFGHIFGYTLNPEPNFNLTTELKNTSNSKKVDGAIVFDGKAIAVIELKGTNTTDLNSIETQAFGYKNNQSECVYVITSNFEKLRFYIDNSIDYEEFNLFTLNREQFNLLYLCLNLQSIQQHLPKRLKDESVSQEDAITKKLYKDYSEFKRALYQNLVELNPEFDKLLLFKKTQKLLDRFLFIFFAEDRLLLPTNLIFRINQEWKNLMKMRMTVSLYDRYKVYFNDLNVGAKVTLPAFGKKTGDAIEAEFEIFAYNGGLFVPDEVLDNVKIDDEVLHVYTEKMSHYDFDSDVDVNILGHIFENSLNEIDEIKSEIEGEAVDKTKTRRKKDGVFYTPKYITKYIVDNTVGKLCTEKKAELKLVDEDYTNDKKIQTKTKKAHLDKLTDYRTWLLQLTICDPACGSGAFLNQALEFLIAEHRYVDELQAKLMGDSLILSDVENSILENNIYGVDLNDESVEIAKLSLWLRTAQKGRKLNSLNNNIKCGNSLIDDPEVAGEKAFSWEKEFPEVFKEKNKFAFHITTALHDSRTSDRMVKYKARERRFEGTKPDPEVFPMTKEEEELIASTVADIVREDKLNIAAFNLCWDHMHILLVCEEEEVQKIMHKIKGRTARACNMLRNKGINPLDVLHKDGSTPFWTQKYGCKPVTTEEHFWNTYNYIENNKVKHDLPKNPKLEKIIFGFVKTYEDCFRTEYNGGFDVVIGNPPYVDIKALPTEIVKELFKKYKTAENRINLYSIFIEKGHLITKDNGFLSFINPNSILINSSYTKIRKMLVDEMTRIVKLPDAVFVDASVETIIFEFRKNIISLSIRLNEQLRNQVGKTIQTAIMIFSRLYRN
jgi:REP element-mobilizing transposase RayT